VPDHIERDPDTAPMTGGRISFRENL
jgi:hypothetical protein